MSGQLPGAPSYPAALRAKLEAAVEAKGEDYEPRTHHLRSDGTAQYTNRLILEDSPYLVQHAHNPVNWYAWGTEAFETAVREDASAGVSPPNPVSGLSANQADQWLLSLPKAGQKVPFWEYWERFPAYSFHIAGCTNHRQDAGLHCVGQFGPSFDDRLQTVVNWAISCTDCIGFRSAFC